MHVWKKTVVLAGAALLVTAGAAASVPTHKSEHLPSTLDRIETLSSKTDLSSWDADVTLSKLGINIDWDQTPSSKRYKTATLSGDLILCTNHAVGMCEFLNTGHPGFAEMYNACTAFHFEDCMDRLRSPNQGIGGQ